MVEKWRKTLDEGSETETILTNLSKAFDCIDHSLLIVKSMHTDFKNNQSLSFILISLK